MTLFHLRYLMARHKVPRTVSIRLHVHFDCLHTIILTMSERPSKRAKRTDSAAMWDEEQPRSAKSTNGSMRSQDREKRDRSYERSSNRHRSRSRPLHGERRPRNEEDRAVRKRSRSKDRQRDDRERYADRPREHRDKRYRDRSRSPDRRVRGEITDVDIAKHFLTTLTDDDRYRRKRSRSRSPARQRPRSPKFKDEAHKQTRASPKPISNGVHKVYAEVLPPSGPRSHRQAPEQNSEMRPKSNSRKEDSQPASVVAPDPPQAMDLDSDPEIAEMQKLMGFTKFKTTKQTKVPGNDWYGKAKEKPTEYRQYMNRVGGFNRPLSPSR